MGNWKVTDDSGALVDKVNRAQNYNFEYESQALRDAREKYANDPEALARINAGVRSFQYRVTPWDLVSLGFGGRAGYEKMMNQYALDYDKYLEQTLNNLETRDYNSESSKIQRSRLAGQNPDLLGIDGGSEENGFTPDETIPEIDGMMPENPFGQAISSLGSVGSVFSNALSIVSGIQQLGINQSDLFMKDIAGQTNLFDMALNQFVKAFPQGFEKEGDQPGAETFIEFFNDFISTFSGPSKKRAQKFVDNVRHGAIDSEYVNSLISEYRNRRVHNDFDSLPIMGNSVYSRDFNSMLDNYISSYGQYIDDIFDLQMQATKAGLSNDMLTYAYDEGYWKKLVDDKVFDNEAEAHKMMIEAQKAVQNMQNKENSLWSSMMNKNPKDMNFFEKALAIAVLFMRSQSQRGFGGFSIGKRSSQAFTPGKFGVGQSQSSGWNIGFN